MKEKMENKVFLRYDFSRERKVLDEIDNSISTINGTLVPELEKIGVTLTGDVLKDCLSGARKLRTEYLAILKKDLDKVGLPSTKSRIESEATEALEQFQDKLVAIRHEIKQQEYISVVDGLAVMTEESKAKLAESCNIYLSDSEQIEAYNHLVEVCNHLNEVFSNDLPMWWLQVLSYSEKENKFSPNPDLNYNYLGGN
jgi:hypothetical protein